MMPERPDFVVEVHVLDVTTGLWCDACRLPSMIEYRFGLVDPDTLHLGSSWSEQHCTECGGP